MPKQTKEDQIKEIKQAATVKVTTIIKVIVIALLLTASFIGGWTARSTDNARVYGEANEIIQKLTSKN